MEIVRDLVLLFHLIGFASLFGGALVQARGPRRVINPAMLHGATTMLVTGLLLVLMLELWSDDPVNHMKIGIKLLVLIAIGVLVFLNRRKENVPAGTFGLIAGLTVANAAIAVLW